MKKMILLFVIRVGTTAILSCAKYSESIQNENPLLQESLTYLQQHYISPEDYVIEKFKTYDVVILGEHHLRKHSPVFVQNLIPLLYQNGMYNIVMEFYDSTDQNLIDALITLETYNETQARTISLSTLTVAGFLGYREYTDILKAAWNVNKNLPKDAKKCVLSVCRKN